MDNTIRGQGHLGANQLKLTNNALIHADTGTLTIDVTGNSAATDTGVDSALDNNSLILADGGDIIITNSRVDNVDGQLKADNGSQVRLNSTRIDGGELISTNGSLIRNDSGTVVLDNVVLTSGSRFEADNATTTQLIDTYTNQGVTKLNGFNTTDLQIVGDLTLTGSGLIDLSASTNNRILGVAGTDRLTNVDNTIRGQGQLGAGQIQLTNQGLIDGNTSGFIVVDPENSEVALNDVGGTIRGSGTGGIRFGSGNFDNQGTIEALDGSEVDYTTTANTLNNSGGTLTGGTWRSIAAGSGSQVTINGGAVETNAADITVSGAGSVFRAREPVNGTTFATLESSLTTNAAAGVLRVLDNRDYTTGNNFDNSGVVQLGGGTFDAGSVTNEANGEIFGFGTLADSVVNHGIVRASGGRLTAQVDGQSGTIQIDGGASMTLAGHSDGDFLTHNGTNLELNGFNVTVDSDYNNASFGVGNGFNARANVTDGIGGGQILASGDVAMEITGDVTGGTTASPFMSFGNVHLGDVVTRNFQVKNAGTTGPDLRTAIQTSVNGGNITDIRLSGSGVTAQNIGPLAAGQSSGDFDVTLDFNTAGAVTGQTIHIENNFDNVANQTIQIQEVGVYRLAAPSPHSPAPIVIGNVRIGDLAQQAVTISNTAVNDGFSERLDAQFGAPTGDATASGSFSLLGPQQSSNSDLFVGIDTSTAGIRAGDVELQLASNGAGTSGLGITALPSQTVNVSGTVFRNAQGNVDDANPVNLGNFRIGDTAQQSISVSNTAATDGFSEQLNATAGATTGDASIAGGFALLDAGSSNTSGVVVGIDTASVGNKSGNATVDFSTGGLAGSSGLAELDIADANVQVQGTVFRAAQGDATPDPINFGNLRVGDATSQALTISNVAAADGFSESLAIGAITESGSAQVGGFVADPIVAGGSDSNLTVALNTNVAGHRTGAVNVDFISTGLGTSGLADLDIADGSVQVEGDVFRLAQGNVTPRPVNFGDRHLGDAASQQLTVTNTAANDGFSEDLVVVSHTQSGDALLGGNIAGALIDAGASNTALTISIDTGTVGNKSGAVAFDYGSDGSDTSGFGFIDVAGDQNLQVNGTVWRLAESDVQDVLDFGNVHVGDLEQQAISVSNVAAGDGFSERLNASFGTVVSGIAALDGSITQLAAGATNNTNMQITLDTSAAGSINADVEVLLASDGTGLNTLGVTALPSEDVNVLGSVTASVIRLANPVINNAQPVAFGNFHVGDALADVALSITNDVPDDGFSELLDATANGVTGGAVGSGSFVGLGPTATDTSSILVGIDTSVAGDRSGAITVDFVSDGTAFNLGVTNLASQEVQITGAGFRLAEAVVNDAQAPTVIDIGNARVGDLLGQTLDIDNTATADGFSEGLRLNAGGVTGDASITGAGTLIAAGGSNSVMQARLDTATVGDKSGTVAVEMLSDGVGTSGLGQTGLGNADLSLSGSVFRTAEGGATPEPIDFGNIRVGDATAQVITITNHAATDGFSESLGANAAATGNAGVGGSLAGLIAAGSTDSGLIASIDSSVAGARSGSIDLDYLSDGAGTSGLAAIAVGGQDVAVSANVFRLAQGLTTPAGPLVIHARKGHLAEQQLAITNVAVADGFSEALAATVIGGGDVALSGSVGGLIQAGTSDTNVAVGIDTATSGAKSGTATINYASDGTGTTGQSQLAAGSDVIAVTGNVYTAAEVQVNNPVVDFGIVHVGETAQAAISVTNSAADEALNDRLRGLVTGASGGFTAEANANLGNGLEAGQSDNSSLALNMDTAVAGIFTGTADMDMFSHNNDMADLLLGNLSVDLVGQVNNFAKPEYRLDGGDGTLTSTGAHDYLLDFGTIDLGLGLVTADLSFLNDIFGPVDLLDGLFDDSGLGLFSAVGIGGFNDLDGGDSVSGIMLSFDPLLLGSFSGNLLLNATAHNASGFSQDIAINLALAAVVTNGASVPEPATWLLLLVGLALIGVRPARVAGRA
ncbi:MAG: choice-of-anchor D domain-containing protein [Immundisolibacteraceae bacterium]|nr:choice-of-anchor D domain-containing protein [Immundisolibacteraceae bacterium]